MPNQPRVEQRLVELKTQHRDLDEAIAALSDATHSDDSQLQRLKKRKLALRDRIAVIEHRDDRPQ